MSVRENAGSTTLPRWSRPNFGPWDPITGMDNEYLCHLTALISIVAERLDDDLFSVSDLLYRHWLFGGRAEESFIIGRYTKDVDESCGRNAFQQTIANPREFEVDPEDDERNRLDISAFLELAERNEHVVRTQDPLRGTLYRLAVDDSGLWKNETSNVVEIIRPQFWTLISFLGGRAFRWFFDHEVCGKTEQGFPFTWNRGRAFRKLLQVVGPSHGFVEMCGTRPYAAQRQYRVNPTIFDQLGLRPKQQFDVVAGDTKVGKADANKWRAAVEQTVRFLDTKAVNGFCRDDLCGEGSVFPNEVTAGQFVAALAEAGEIRTNDQFGYYVFTPEVLKQYGFEGPETRESQQLDTQAFPTHAQGVCTDRTEEQEKMPRGKSEKVNKVSVNDADGVTTQAVDATNNSLLPLPAKSITDKRSRLRLERVRKMALAFPVGSAISYRAAFAKYLGEWGDFSTEHACRQYIAAARHEGWVELVAHGRFRWNYDAIRNALLDSGAKLSEPKPTSKVSKSESRSTPVSSPTPPSSPTSQAEGLIDEAAALRAALHRKERLLAPLKMPLVWAVRYYRLWRREINETLANEPKE